MSEISQQIVRILLEDDIPVADQIEQNMGLVYNAAKDFANISRMPGIEFDDLVSYGKIGLIRALKLWKPEKGSLSTFATAVIKNDLRKLYTRQKEQSREMTTLDAPLRGEEEEEGAETGQSQLSDDSLAADVDTALSKKETETALELAIASIKDPRVRACIAGFKNGKSYRDLGAELGVSQTMAANWTNKGLNQLRNFLVRTKKMSLNPSTGMLEADEMLAVPENEARKMLNNIIAALNARAAKLQRTPNA